MLSTALVGRPGPTPSRWRTVAAAIAPTARVAHLGAAAATVGLAAIPTLVTVVRGDAVVSTPLAIAGLVGGATLAWAADDPAADLLGSVPLSSPLRAALRVACVAAVGVLGVALIALVVALGPGLPPDIGDRAPEAAAAAALGLAVGFMATRSGERNAGPVGVTAGVLGTLVVSALAFRWPALLPAFLPSPIHARWWLIAAVGLLVVARAARDPGRR